MAVPGLGIFEGLWGGISNTLGRGADEIAERSGSADKARAYNYALQQSANNARTQQLVIIVIGVVLLAAVAIFLSKKQQ